MASRDTQVWEVGIGCYLLSYSVRQTVYIVRQPNNVLLWTNAVRQKDSVLVLSIPFETVNFVQFS